MAQIFQADADRLQHVSTLFHQSAQLADEAMQDLQWHANQLQNAWIGQGATAFYTELEQRILPFLKSLSDALLASNSQVNTLMKHTIDAERTIRSRLVR